MPSILRQLVAAAKGRMFAPEIFSGSDLSYRIGKIIFKIGDGLKASRRRVRRWLRSPALARRLSRFRRSVAKRDWVAALERAREIARLAEAARDVRLMEEMGIALLRLGDYRLSGRLRLESRRLVRGVDPKEWTGEDISGTLLVNFIENEAQGISGTIKHGRFLVEAAKHAKLCVALVERRLVPLFGRSFPSVDVRAAIVGTQTAAYSKADKIAGFEHLNAYLGADADMIVRTYVPLRPDPKTVEEISARYRGDFGDTPLIGISWGSTAYAKDTPGLEDWIALIKSTDAKFVSLQYGSIAGEIVKIEAGAGKSVIHDTTVDQLTDMDRFAAQIASLDAVVTISNTGAHLAGALGVPTIIIIDDNFRRAWPVGADRTPYYPAAIIVAKNGRSWSRVIEEIKEKLRKILARRAR